jgi:hypothetical protein
VQRQHVSDQLAGIEAASRARVRRGDRGDYWPVCYWWIIHTKSGLALCPACTGAANMRACIQPRMRAAARAADDSPCARTSWSGAGSRADAVIAVSGRIAGTCAPAPGSGHADRSDPEPGQRGGPAAAEVGIEATSGSGAGAVLGSRAEQGHQRANRRHRARLPWSLIVAGDGPTGPRWNSRRGRQPRVEFTGWADRKRLHDALAGASMLISFARVES